MHETCSTNSFGYGTRERCSCRARMCKKRISVQFSRLESIWFVWIEFNRYKKWFRHYCQTISVSLIFVFSANQESISREIMAKEIAMYSRFNSIESLQNADISTMVNTFLFFSSSKNKRCFLIVGSSLIDLPADWNAS